MQCISIPFNTLQKTTQTKYSVVWYSMEYSMHWTPFGRVVSFAMGPLLYFTVLYCTHMKERNSNDFGPR